MVYLSEQIENGTVTGIYSVNLFNITSITISCGMADLRGLVFEDAYLKSRTTQRGRFESNWGCGVR